MVQELAMSVRPWGVVSVNNLPCFFYEQADLQLLNENGRGTAATVADASEAILSRL